MPPAERVLWVAVHYGTNLTEAAVLDRSACLWGSQNGVPSSQVRRRAHRPTDPSVWTVRRATDVSTRVGMEMNGMLVQADGYLTQGTPAVGAAAARPSSLTAQSLRLSPGNQTTNGRGGTFAAPPC